MIKLFTIILLPLVLSNIIHMVIVKLNYFQFLSIPLCTKLFGINKTWRGFILVSVLNSLLCWMIYLVLKSEMVSNPLFTGFLLGVFYMLFELPNSFLKRRVGIGSGEKANGIKSFFIILDKTDSAFGVSLISYFLFSLSITDFLLLFFISVIIHSFFSILLVLLRIKQSF